MRWEKMSSFRIKQHTSEKWTKAVQKLFNTDQIRYFGIMHMYGSYILNFHCHFLKHTQLPIHSYHLATYEI